LINLQPQQGKSSSKIHNSNMEQIHKLLLTLYEESVDLLSKVSQHQKISQSTFESTRAAVEAAQDQMTTVEAALNAGVSGTVIYEKFRNEQSFEANTSLYTERDGSAVTSSNICIINPEEEALSLPLVDREDIVVSRTGSSRATVKITRRGGTGSATSITPLKNVIDSSDDTYWLEDVYTDEPIRVPIPEDDIATGAVFEVEVSLHNLATINEIVVAPFSRYPVRLVSVKAYLTEDEDENPTVIIGPSDSALAGGPQYFLTTKTWQIQSRPVKRLRFLFVQEHFSINTRYVPKYYPGMGALAKSLESGLEVKDWPRNIIEEPRDFLNRLSIRDTTETLYHYSYGLSNLKARKNEYSPLGVYLSRPIETGWSLREGRLYVVEDHPKFDIPLTSIEYYLDDGTQSYPIFPVNKDRERGELLSFDSSYSASLRFLPDGEQEITVRRGAQTLTREIDYTITGTTVTILRDFRPSSVYSADYTPVESARQVVLEHTSRDLSEVLYGNGTSKLELSMAPYLDREILNLQPPNYNPTYLGGAYVPISVSITTDTGEVLEQARDTADTSFHVQNVTDYNRPNLIRLNPFDEFRRIYEYQVIGANLIFNREVPVGWRVLVRYQTTCRYVRVKAIMRRILNSTGSEGFTPLLKDYHLLLGEVK
jgi:hypothetical protein